MAMGLLWNAHGTTDAVPTQHAPPVREHIMSADQNATSQSSGNQPPPRRRIASLPSALKQPKWWLLAMASIALAVGVSLQLQHSEERHANPATGAGPRGPAW